MVVGEPDIECPGPEPWSHDTEAKRGVVPHKCGTTPSFVSSRLPPWNDGHSLLWIGRRRGGVPALALPSISSRLNFEKTSPTLLALPFPRDESSSLASLRT